MLGKVEAAVPKYQNNSRIDAASSEKGVIWQRSLDLPLRQQRERIKRLKFSFVGKNLRTIFENAKSINIKLFSADIVTSI